MAGSQEGQVRSTRIALISGAVGVLLVAAGGTAMAATHTQSTGASGPSRPTAKAADSDWTTYHRDNSRAGVATGLAPVGTLGKAWTAKLDGAVYGQPLVVGQHVYAATENDTVYELDIATGKVLWQTHVGTPVPLSKLPCGDIDPLGITSTMVYDPATNLLFALAEVTGGTHNLVSLDATTGTLKQTRAAEPPKGTKLAHQQRAALNLVNNKVYIAYGGLLGDCSNYIGSVVALPTTGTGAKISFAVPTSREGGIWAPGGGAVVGGKLMYAVGNGASTSGKYDGSDSVIALDDNLKQVDLFAPSTWADDNAKDLDLGSMTPIQVGSFVYTDGKRGTGYTARADHLGNIGGQVAQANVCKAFGAPAVMGNTAYLPCTDGTRQVTIDSTGKITVGWHLSVAARGSPTIGGGAVWVVDYTGGTLYAVDPGTGAIKQQISIGVAPHFVSPTLSQGKAFVGTNAGVVAVSGA
jgi:polyvinyl alcohol dehydrogenase (cytochrome)